MYWVFDNNQPLKIDVPTKALCILGVCIHNCGACMYWVFDDNQPLKIDVPTDDHKLALPSRLNELRQKCLQVFILIIIIFINVG